MQNFLKVHLVQKLAQNLIYINFALLLGSYNNLIGKNGFIQQLNSKIIISLKTASNIWLATQKIKN